jgi:hypothetical protein
MRAFRQRLRRQLISVPKCRWFHVSKNNLNKRYRDQVVVFANGNSKCFYVLKGIGNLGLF